MIIPHPQCLPTSLSSSPFTLHTHCALTIQRPPKAQQAPLPGTLHLLFPSSKHLSSNICMIHPLTSLSLCSESTFRESPFLTSLSVCFVCLQGTCHQLTYYIHIFRLTNKIINMPVLISVFPRYSMNSKKQEFCLFCSLWSLEQGQVHGRPSINIC